MSQQPDEADRKRVVTLVQPRFFWRETLINAIILNFHLAIQFEINCSAVSNSYASIYGNSFISVGNHMISSAIWDKSARVNFSKANNL